MINRFETLTTAAASICKSIRTIQGCRMGSIGMHGTDVMCLYFLKLYSDGLTAAELSEKCRADKAGISRILASLEERQLIEYKNNDCKRKYRARAILTKEGLESAEKLSGFIDTAVNIAGEGITESERETFYRILIKIDENLKQQAAELKSKETNAAGKE